MFPSPLVSASDVDQLDTNNVVDRLTYVFDAITLTRHKLEGKVPLIGFTGAPVRGGNVFFWWFYHSFNITSHSSGH